MSNGKIWAGNTLNRIISDPSVSFLARLAVWISYYPLMYRMADDYRRIERMIARQLAPPTPLVDPAFIMSTEMEEDSL